ncbi:winged helix DNA-binding domain-containing protein [bacterium]|nr:winged helix DNA-binding domain-containing protein [bacterium]
MIHSDVAQLRLANQGLIQNRGETPSEIVSWLGAIQAQDYTMAKWAIGVRLPGSTEKTIEAALDGGDILRTHVLRPTWHFVTGEDIHWMLELTAPHIRSSMKSRHKQLGLSASVLSKSYAVIEKFLMGNNHSTRDELMAKLEKAKISTKDSRASHIFLMAELDGLICSGVLKGKKTTYALLDERISKKKKMTREESLYKLSSLYFSSHGPATLQDFIWWSGLPVGDAKSAFQTIRKNFIEKTIDKQNYLMKDSSNQTISSAFLLPAFDEFLISYKNRKASIPSGNFAKAISNNGIFWPTITINGQVEGTWKRILKKDRMSVVFNFFNKKLNTTTQKKLLEKTTEDLKLFFDYPNV